MRRFDDFNPRRGSSPEAGSNEREKRMLSSMYRQHPLDDIGGEPLAGSGFRKRRTRIRVRTCGGEPKAMTASVNSHQVPVCESLEVTRRHFRPEVIDRIIDMLEMGEFRGRNYGIAPILASTCR
jgi:hypothetical protein